MTMVLQTCLQEKRRCPSWLLFLTVFVFRPVCDSIYPHFVQVAVVLHILWTTSTVRCPITMTVASLVAAGLMLLPNTEHSSALQLSGSTPALRYSTPDEQSPLQHTLFRKSSAICTQNPNYSILLMPAAFHGMSSTAGG